MFTLSRRKNKHEIMLSCLPAMKTTQVYDLDQTLISFSPGDHWSIRDACTGTMVMGGTGSGKTSGSGRALAHAFLRAGFGGIVLCAKPGERQLWERYAWETGRHNSLIVFDASGRRCFNFLDYELRRGDRLVTHNLVSLFMRIMEVAKQREGGSEDGFWKDAVAELLGNAFLVLYSAWGTVTLAGLMSLISSAPRTEAQGKTDEWRSGSYCYQSLVKMFKDPTNRLPEHDALVAANFFRQRWAGAAEKMRSGIEFSLSSLAAPFLTGYLRQLFCTETNVIPEFTHQGAIIVVDLPIKEHGEAGILAQHVWKYLFQRAAERRNGDDPRTRPVFLWADECQFFISSYDGEFQSTARSSKACTVYLTQSLPAIYERMGKNSEHSAHALLNNFQNRIFHQNLDPTTNNYASDLLGEIWMTLCSHGTNTSRSSGSNIGESVSDAMSYSHGNSGTWSTSSTKGYTRGYNSNKSSGSNVSYSQTVEREILPSTFARLRQGGRGGPPQAIVVQGGRMFYHSGRPYLFCEFPQA